MNRRKIIFGYLKNEYGYVFVQNTQLVINVGYGVIELSLSWFGIQFGVYINL